ncbi:MAG: hypothetical protein LUQ06_06095, partial [Methylococcaceae bacterium]|nr:hypothetical protein [Methylococcaceae bacterium]
PLEFMVPRGGIEPSTRGFSVLCSKMAPVPAPGGQPQCLPFKKMPLEAIRVFNRPDSARNRLTHTSKSIKLDRLSRTGLTIDERQVATLCSHLNLQNKITFKQLVDKPLNSQYRFV